MFAEEQVVKARFGSPAKTTSHGFVPSLHGGNDTARCDIYNADRIGDVIHDPHFVLRTKSDAHRIEPYRDRGDLVQAALGRENLDAILDSVARSQKRTIVAHVDRMRVGRLEVHKIRRHGPGHARSKNSAFPFVFDLWRKTVVLSFVLLLVLIFVLRAFAVDLLLENVFPIP